MSLFQNSVVSKYLKSQNRVVLSFKWAAYKSHFLNLKVQEEIKSLKEEQYQGEFLEDLFVKILGYTKPASSSETKFNLTTEYKNIKDSKKADGAIIIKEKVKAVIELKGTNTTDLNKIEVQAFGYKNNQPECVYVITSNFEKLRFYIDNAIEYLEFNLFTLNEEEFSLLYLCLAFDNLSNDVPKKIKDESVSQEDSITKKLYKDYSLFKRELHQSLVLLNPDYEPIELFKKSQKLLDRFLFIFFAEDRNLLPTNLIFRINKEWKQLRQMRIEVSLYDRYKIYFKDLNTGARVSLPAFSQTFATEKEEHQIFAYNGGLFKPDEILDNVLIDDAILFAHTENLSNYDFASEVDVNILGHIFENSLNELDEMKAQLEGSPNPSPKEKGIGKRKKDGVFYTPKYITKYIVENTVGKLCKEQKEFLQLIDEDYTTDKKRTKATKQPLLDKLTQYRNWILQITIIDPACGSGAFLNEALNFLIAEHTYIDELQAKLFGDALVLSDVEKSILENNLFGVDLNEESVEIAKLSLWLRTAQPNRKLNDLNHNIKCGNSLIDDPTVAGDKAFNWQNEFPNIFKEKNNQAYHLVFTTHNSRTSQRMIDYRVKKGPAVVLGLTEEIALTTILKDIILENGYNCLAYNICKDHIHLVLVCQETALTSIVQKIKSVSSKLFHRLDIPMGHDPLEHKNHLWSQKFFFAKLDELIWADISPKPGHIATDSYLDNAINYIKTNRTKHNLPESKELKNIIKDFVVDIDVAFRPEFNGGFDVVIGNPPYGASFSELEKNYISTKYISYQYKFESYLYFYEKGIELINENGYLSYITPELFLRLEKSANIRKILLEKSNIIELKFCGEDVFEAVKVNSVILTLNNRIRSEENFKIVYENDKSINFSKTRWHNSNNYILDYEISDDTNLIINKIIKNTVYLEKVGNCIQGLTAYDSYRGQSQDIIKNRAYHFKEKVDENCGKWLDGKHLNRYILSESEEWLQYGNWLAAPRESKFFELPRLLFREIPGFNKRIQAIYTDEKYYYGHSITPFILNDEAFDLKFILSIVNSKLISWYASQKCANFSKKTFPKLNPKDIKELPIKIISKSDQKPFIEKADLMLFLNKELQDQSQKFQRTISRKFFSEEANAQSHLSKKLQDWYLLSYAHFVKELSKLKIKLTLAQEAEWEDYFIIESKKASDLKSQIDATDKAIDTMVYELYGLSDEEIAIVESS